MKKIIWLTALILVSFGYIYVANQSRTVPRVVFCDVGQGDAIYVRLPEQLDVLIDSGPYNQVVSCLNEEMPYFDRIIELVFITHPEKDHFGGLAYLLETFQIQSLYLPEIIKNQSPESALWKNLMQQLRNGLVKTDYLSRGDRIKVGNSVFDIVSPEINSSSLKDVDYNNSSLGMVAQLRDKQILLLSDMDVVPAEKAIEQLNLHTDLFKINHHGSKYGTSRRLLQLANPSLVVISVGKNNWYGHPHPETIQLLQSLNILIKRTDKQGKIVFML